MSTEDKEHAYKKKHHPLNKYYMGVVGLLISFFWRRLAYRNLNYFLPQLCCGYID
jgi:hypothetical protein